MGVSVRFLPLTVRLHRSCAGKHVLYAILQTGADTGISKLPRFVALRIRSAVHTFLKVPPTKDENATPQRDGAMADAGERKVRFLGNHTPFAAGR